MLSPRQRTFWTLLAVLLLAAAVAAWWTRDHWADRVQPWAEQAWRKATRPGADTLPQDRKATPGAAASAPWRPRPANACRLGAPSTPTSPAHPAARSNCSKAAQSPPCRANVAPASAAPALCITPVGVLPDGSFPTRHAPPAWADWHPCRSPLLESRPGRLERRAGHCGRPHGHPMRVQA